MSVSGFARVWSELVYLAVQMNPIAVGGAALAD